MNGLKVYLKSGITKAYHYAQGVLGILLIANALREYERIEGQKLQLFLTVLAGTMLVLGWLVPKSFRRKVRLLPGLMMVLGGLSLIFLTKSSAAIAYYRYNNWLEIFGYLYCIVGAIQPLIDVTHVAYFTSEGIRYKSNLFFSTDLKWADVKGIVYHESGYSVELNKGKTIRMVPFDANSQNLRVYIDKMRLQAKSNAVASNGRGGTQPQPLQSTPETAA
jgi:hypothetical protein